MPRILSSPRSRVLNFRLTDDEYQEIRSACSVHGLRCVSDLARIAVLQFAKTHALPAGVDGLPGRRQSAIEMHLSSLDATLSRVNSRLEQLVDILSRCQAPNPPAGPYRPAGPEPERR